MDGGRGELGDTKSANDGPAFNLSLNFVEDRGASGLLWGCGTCESTVVASERENWETECEVRGIEVMGEDANRQRARGI